MTEPEADRWQALPPAILRSAGFPISLLDPLVLPEVRRAFEALDSENLRLTNLRRRILPELVRGIRQAGAGGDARRLRRVKELVRSYRSIEDAHVEAPELISLISSWNASLAHRDGLLDHCVAGARQAEVALTDSLVALARDASVAESIFINSPSALEAIEKARLLPESHARRTLVGYLQRFATKVETASFFGPTNFLAIDADIDGGISLSRSEPGWRATRHVLISYWAAQAVALRLRSNGCAQAHLRLYRGAAPDLRDGSVPQEIERSILAEANGSVSIGRLAVRLQRPPHEIVDRALQLEVRGMLRIGLRIPSSAAEPIATLIEMMEGEDLDDDSQAILRYFEHWRAAFEQAAFAHRRRLLAQAEAYFALKTAGQPRRASGAFYGDRFIYVEEALGNLQGRVSEEFLKRIAAQLGTALDVLASEAVDARIAGYGLVSRALGAVGNRAGDLFRLPYEAPGIALGRARIDKWRRLMPDPAQPVVRLTRRELLNAGLIREDLEHWPLFCAPDLMLGGTEDEIAAGKPTYLVLSETHHIIPLVTLLSRQFRDQSEARFQEVLGFLQDALASPNLMVAAIDRLTKAVDYTSAGMHLLCLDYLCSEPDATPVPVGELTVDFAGGRARLVRGDTVYSLLPDYGDFPPDLGLLRELALPAVNKDAFSLGRHTPRVEIEGVVFQRERWDYRGQDLDLASGRRTPDDVLRQVWDFKSRERIPDRVFVKASGEEKPFYVDFASPDLCLMLTSHARGSPAIGISEALPLPAASWLTTSAGRHCCELRLTVTRRMAL